MVMYDKANFIKGSIKLEGPETTIRFVPRELFFSRQERLILCVLNPSSHP